MRADYRRHGCLRIHSGAPTSNNYAARVDPASSSRTHAPLPSRSRHSKSWPRGGCVPSFTTRVRPRGIIPQRTFDRMRSRLSDWSNGSCRVEPNPAQTTGGSSAVWNLYAADGNSQCSQLRHSFHICRWHRHQFQFNRRAVARLRRR
jgi:hypothetical protein